MACSISEIRSAVFSPVEDTAASDAEECAVALACASGEGLADVEGDELTLAACRE